jgi:2-iminobutanoate/2-iminopropanoate deaminase
MTTFSNPAGVAAPIGQYSHVARIDLGDKALLFIAGQVALDPGGNLTGRGDAAAQADQIHQNLKVIMEANGGTLSDIVKTTVFVTDITSRASLAEVRKRYFGDAAPTSTLVEVSSLATDDYLVEIEAVAVVAST